MDETDLTDEWAGSDRAEAAAAAAAPLSSPPWIKTLAVFDTPPPGLNNIPSCCPSFLFFHSLPQVALSTALEGLPAGGKPEFMEMVVSKASTVRELKEAIMEKFGFEAVSKCGGV